MTIPAGHLAQAQLLRAQPIVDLWELKNSAGTVIFRFKQDNTDSWNGHTWEGVAIMINNQVTRTGTGEVSRPQLDIANGGNALLMQYAYQDTLRGGSVVRYRVLKSDLDAGTVVYVQENWIISKMIRLTRQIISYELRSPADGFNFFIPGRMFCPPEFPGVI